MRKFLTISLLLLMCVPMMVHAQIAVDDTLNVYFRQNEKTFRPDLKENGNRMADFVEHFERL